MSPIDPAYIAHRARETAAFEARARGEIPHRTKGNREGIVQTPKQKLFQQNGANMLTNITETIEQPRQRQPHRTPLPAAPAINQTPPAAAAPSVAPVQPLAPPLSLLDIILKAGTDPNFDVEKFERLVAIQQNEQDREEKRAEHAAKLAAEAAFNAAMTDVQRQMGRIATDAANASTHSRYASYGALDRAIRPLYTAAGFRISYNEDVGAAPAEMVRVLAYVTHTAPGGRRSHTETYHTDVPVDGKGARGGDVMSKTHANKSGKTYGKRELLGMIFNIATGKDDDGNAAGGARSGADAPLPGTISPAQAEEIRMLLEQGGISQRAFLQFIRLPRIEDIGAEHFERAKAKIKSFGSKS